MGPQACGIFFSLTLILHVHVHAHIDNGVSVTENAYATGLVQKQPQLASTLMMRTDYLLSDFSPGHLSKSLLKLFSCSFPECFSL